MVELEEKIIAFLKSSPNSSFNLSEIGRAIGKAPPTVKRAIDKLEQQRKVKITNKRSMKLIELVG